MYTIRRRRRSRRKRTRSCRRSQRIPRAFGYHAEAEMDEEKLREEIEAARKEAEAAFNAKTGSYSGRYGSKPVENEEEQQQINAILTEKPDAFDSAMSALQDQE